ncbi:PIG-L deacetylase family protein [Pelagibius sp.]|uniref:PIG-L deacetylase family protein n=1 Tax=Pelagibius sp. TaxID=1931238 RepID=UPI0026035BE6|nr:PIG-L deacetylase family protein [Pelagibius sp.]
MASGKDILIVAAHPDDEVLGVGGTAARHADEGDKVHVLILAEGSTSRGEQRDRNAHGEAIDALKQAARAAADCLGTQPPRFAGLPDNRMDQLDLLDIIKHVEAAVKEVDPAIIYTHHGGDLNLDHRLTHQAVLTACRPLPGARVEAIYAFETLSASEWSTPEIGRPFIPCHFVDVSRYLDSKRKALECYHREMRPFPHSRSIENVEYLARFRGGCVGFEAAEGFSVCRQLRF